MVWKLSGITEHNSPLTKWAPLCPPSTAEKRQMDCLFPWEGDGDTPPGETRGGASQGHPSLLPCSFLKALLRRSPGEHRQGGPKRSEPHVASPGALPHPLTSWHLAALRQAGGPEVIKRESPGWKSVQFGVNVHLGEFAVSLLFISGHVGGRDKSNKPFLGKPKNLRALSLLGKLPTCTQMPKAWGS